MKIGTKSLLYGAHQFALHPFFVALAWRKLCLLHSRSLARRYDEPVSQLCAPDKLAAFMMPRWLYIRLATWTGELEEYMAEADTSAGRA